MQLHRHKLVRGQRPLFRQSVVVVVGNYEIAARFTRALRLGTHPGVHDPRRNRSAPKFERERIPHPRARRSGVQFARAAACLNMESGMSKSTFRVGMTAASLFTSAMVHAQDSWSTRAEAGFVAAHGNSSTETANAKIEIIREINKWK